MADEQMQLTPEQVYLQSVLEKFNTNPNDPSLKDVEKVLLNKIRGVQLEIAELSKEIDQLNKEINERQEKGNDLVQKIVHKRGQSQGYIDALLSLRN